MRHAGSLRLACCSICQTHALFRQSSREEVIDMSHESEIARLREAIGDADTIVVGAGAGLSTTAGLTYAGERFERLFPDFIAKYGIRDMYSGGFSRSLRPRNAGHGGAGTFGATATNLRRKIPTASFARCSTARTSSSSPRTSTTSSSLRVSPRSACSIRRATTVFGSAASHATIRLTTTTRLSSIWLSGNAACACRPSSYPTALYAGSR